MHPRSRLGPSQALWNPGVSAPTTFLAQDSAPAAPISSRTPSKPSFLRHKKSKSLPGGFKLSELEPRAGSSSTSSSPSAPSAASLLRALLLSPSPSPSPTPASPTSSKTLFRSRRISLPSSPAESPTSRSSPLPVPTSLLVLPPTPPQTLRRRPTSGGGIGAGAGAGTLDRRRSISISSLVSLPPLPQTQPSSSPPTLKSVRPTIKTRPRLLSGTSTALAQHHQPARTATLGLQLQLEPRPKPTLLTLPLPILTLILTYTIHSLPSIHHPLFLSSPDHPPQTVAARTKPTTNGAGGSRTRWSPFVLCLTSKLVRSISMKLLYFRIQLGAESWRGIFGKPMSRAEKLARTVGKNAGIGGLVRVLEVVVGGEDLLRFEGGGGGGGERRRHGLRELRRGRGDAAGEGEGEIVAGEGLQSLALILGSCKNLSVLEMTDPERSPSSSSALEEEDEEEEDMDPRRQRRQPSSSTFAHSSLLPSSSSNASNPNPITTLLLAPLSTLNSLQSYTHHPSLPFDIIPSSASSWPNLTILSLPLLLPRSDGWSPSPAYLPSILQTITPLLPKLERLVLRLSKPTIAQLNRPPNLDASPSPTRNNGIGILSPRRLHRTRSPSHSLSPASTPPPLNQQSHPTPHEPFLSFLHFVTSLLPPAPLSFIHLELYGPTLTPSEEISLVALGIRCRATFPPAGRVGFRSNVDDEGGGRRSRLSVVGRSVCCFLGDEPLGTVTEEEEGVGGRKERLENGFGGGEEERETERGEEEVGRWREGVVVAVGGGGGGEGSRGEGGRWNGEVTGMVGFKERRGWFHDASPTRIHHLSAPLPSPSPSVSRNSLPHSTFTPSPLLSRSEAHTAASRASHSRLSQSQCCSVS